MINSIKIHNIFDITKISKSMELNKCFHWEKYLSIYLSVSYEFLKFNGSNKIKVWHSQWYHRKMDLS